MNPKIQKITFGLLAIISSILIYFYQQIRTFQSTEGKFLVTQVLDGDSFVIAPDQSIRLANIDAPEKGRCYSDLATDFLTDLILGKYVDIKHFGKDNYKRSLSLVYLPNGQMVNAIMAENGMGIYTSTKTDAREEINKIVNTAKTNKIGVFSDVCSQSQNLTNPNCSIKGNIGKHDRKKYYHISGCRDYVEVTIELHLGEQWFCTEKEAIEAGYVKSKYCP